MKIGLSGKMGVGKSTVAQVLQRKIGDKAQIFSFGGVLKQEVSDTYQFPLKWCYSQDSKELEVDLSKIPVELSPNNQDKATVRLLLMWYGTEYRRVQDYDYWTKALDKVIKESDSEIAIIDDVRFENEAEFVKEDGMLFRIEPYKDWNKHSDHISETALDNYGKFDGWYTPVFGSLEWIVDDILDTLMIDHIYL